MLDYEQKESNRYKTNNQFKNTISFSNAKSNLT